MIRQAFQNDSFFWLTILDGFDFLSISFLYTDCYMCFGKDGTAIA
jgi:hypothetical protein